MKSIDPVKAGRKGGKSTRDKHGSKFFAKIARKRWKKAKKAKK